MAGIAATVTTLATSLLSATRRWWRNEVAADEDVPQLRRSLQDHLQSCEQYRREVAVSLAEIRRDLQWIKETMGRGGSR